MNIPSQKRAAVALCATVLLVGGGLVAAKAVLHGRSSPARAAPASPAADPADVAPPADPMGSPSSSELPDQPAPQNPVRAKAHVAPTTVRPGETAELTVAIRIAPGWHIQAMDRSGSMAEPTSLELNLPPGIELVDGWIVPDPDLDPSGSGPVTRVYAADVSFRCRLRVSEAVTPRRQELVCRLGYQACNRFSCRPFHFEAMSVALEILDSPAAEQ